LAKPALHAPLHIPPLHDGEGTLLLLQAMPQPPQLLALVLVLMLQPLVLRVLSLQVGALLRQQHIDSATQLRYQSIPIGITGTACAIAHSTAA